MFLPQLGYPAVVSRALLPHFTLSRKTLLFLSVFLLSVLVQMGISNYQADNIIEPLNRMTDQVQAVSQFMETSNSTLDELSGYRWDYGDSEALLAEVGREREEALSWLGMIDRDIESLTRSQYIAAEAHAAMAESFDSLMLSFMGLIREGKADEASELYYSEITVCGKYLIEYSERLINALLQGNQEQSYRIRRLSFIISQVQAGIFLFDLLIGIIVFYYVKKTLDVFRSMESAAKEISKGNFDCEDVKGSREPEVESLAVTFNDMKRSMSDRVRLLEERNELQALLEKGKLQMLRSQVNPHFLFNTLNVIKLSSDEEGAPRTGEMIQALARMFRYSLETEEQVVPLSRELVIVEEYAKLCKARFRDKVGFKAAIGPGLDVTELLVPSFILQPVVENSYIHGLGKKEGPGVVCLSVERRGDLLAVTIEDDGAGMSPEKLKEVRESLGSGDDGHIGLRNVCSRLRLSSPRAGMEIESEEGKGTRVTLIMEYIEQEEEAEDGQDTDC